MVWQGGLELASEEARWEIRRAEVLVRVRVHLAGVLWESHRRVALLFEDQEQGWLE